MAPTLPDSTNLGIIKVIVCGQKWFPSQMRSLYMGKAIEEMTLSIESHRPYMSSSDYETQSMKEYISRGGDKKKKTISTMTKRSALKYS